MYIYIYIYDHLSSSISTSSFPRLAGAWAAPPGFAAPAPWPRPKCPGSRARRIPPGPRCLRGYPLVMTHIAKMAHRNSGFSQLTSIYKGFSKIAMENPLEMEVSSWENQLFLWVIFHGYVSHNQRVVWWATWYATCHDLCTTYVQLMYKMLGKNDHSRWLMDGNWLNIVHNSGDNTGILSERF